MDRAAAMMVGRVIIRVCVDERSAQDRCLEGERERNGNRPPHDPIVRARQARRQEVAGSALPVPGGRGLMRPMTDGRSHEIQVSASSLEDLREVLGVTGDLEAEEIDLGQGLVLKNASVIKSSGFDTTAFVLQGVMTIVTSTSSALLVAYLKDRLLSKPGVSASVDGKVVEPTRRPD
jgi:hypothetical protein